MPRKSQSLQELAFKAIPIEVRRTINTDAKFNPQKTVVDRLREELLQKHRVSVSKWASTVKISVKIQGLLILANHFTKLDFYNALNNIRSKNDNNRYSLRNYGDYFDEYVEFINERDLLKMNSPRQQGTLKKWHFLLKRTFYLLCYKRLNHIFKLNEDYEDDDSDKYYGKFFRDIVFSLDDTDVLPLVIYNLLDRTYDIEAIRF